MTETTNETIPTQLIEIITVGNQILQLLIRIVHSRTICIKFYEKVSSCQQFLKTLPNLYRLKKIYFYQMNYVKAFEALFNLYTNSLQFLQYIEKKGKLTRLINSDKYKKCVYNTLKGLDLSLSRLKLSLYLQQNFHDLVIKKLPELPTEDEVQQHEEGKEESLFDLKHFLNTSFTKKSITQDINQLDTNSSETMNQLKEIEVLRSDIQNIPNTLPRQGSKYTVHKRKYKGKVVAEKVLQDKFETLSLINQYKRQLLILNKLSVCKFILPILGISVRSSAISLICEYSELGSLKSYLESSNPITYDIQLQITSDIVEGITFLHEMEIMHKNLKTSNIVLDTNSRAKLTGFEYSRPSTLQTEILQEDLVGDRFRWLAPEKIIDFTDFTKSSDIYSLGTLIWSIFSRKYPYEILTRKKVECLVLQGHRENLNLVPRDVQPLVAACWKHLEYQRPNIDDILEVMDWLTIKNFNNDQFVDLDKFDEFGLNFYLKNNLRLSEDVKTTGDFNKKSKTSSNSSNDVSFIFNCYKYDFKVDNNNRVSYSTYDCEDFKSKYSSPSTSSLDNENEKVEFNKLIEDVKKHVDRDLFKDLKKHLRSKSDYDLSSNLTNRHIKNKISGFSLDSIGNSNNHSTTLNTAALNESTRNMSRSGLNSFTLNNNTNTHMKNKSGFSLDNIGDCYTHSTALKDTTADKFNGLPDTEKDFLNCFDPSLTNINCKLTNHPKKRTTSLEIKIQVGLEIHFDLESPNNTTVTATTSSPRNTFVNPLYGSDLKISQFTKSLAEAIQHHNINLREKAFQHFLNLQTVSKTFTTTATNDSELLNNSISKLHYYLGYYYFWGEPSVCTINYKLAYQHLSLSANLNNSDAIDHLGLYYSNLEVGELNYNKAFKLFKKAADSNNRKGHYHLGICYWNGRGTYVNKAKAEKCFKKADQLGHPLAKFYL